MSQLFDILEDEHDVSSSDDDVLNPEDIDMEDASHFPAHRNTSSHEGVLRSEDSKDCETEDDASNTSIGGFDDEVLDELEQDLELYEYWEETHGVLDCFSVNGVPRTPLLLQAITHNIAALRTVITWDLKEMEEDEYEVLKNCTMATKDELSHLQNHPEVFPSKDVEEEFWQEVYELCDSIAEHIIPNFQGRVEETQNIQAFGVELEHDTFLPIRDLQRKPWEQYLHNRAPGVKVDLPDHGSEGSLQIFPMAAVRIVMGMVEETRAIISDIESQREDGTPYQENPMPGLYAKRERLLTDGTLRSHRTTGELLQPIIAGSMDASRNLDLNTLETLNQDFAALNRRRAPLRPRMWNCIGVIIQDRPQPNVDPQSTST